MPTEPKRSPLSSSDDLYRRLNELQTELGRVRAEANFASQTAVNAARILRVSRKGRWEAEAQAGWERLSPPPSIVRWTPRSAPVDPPDLAQSLIERLKAGDPVASSMNNTSSTAVLRYRDAVMALLPAGYWRMGESSGTVAADSSGHGLTGTYVGAPTLGAAGALAGDSDTGMLL
jgi:hypothetical protein